MNDDYLWDGSGEPDAELAALEKTLGTLRYDAPMPDVSPRLSSRPPAGVMAAAAILVLGLGIGAFVAIGGGGQRAAGTTPRVESPDAGTMVALVRPDASGESMGCTSVDEKAPWAIAVLAGAPRCSNVTLGGTTQLAVGGFLETDSNSKAAVQVADIGRVVLSPGSRLSLEASGKDEHRMSLERGKLYAQIDAPPRLFVVETPSAVAVDLGCEYTLEVAENGDTHIHVTNGYVSLERGAREVYIPAGYMSDAIPGVGPTLPYREDADASYRRLLRDHARDPETVSMQQVLEASGAADTLTLWHLLPRSSMIECEWVDARLRALSGQRVEAACGGVTFIDDWFDVLEERWDPGLENSVRAPKKWQRPRPPGKGTRTPKGSRAPKGSRSKNDPPRPRRYWQLQEDPFPQ